MPTESVIAKVQVATREKVLALFERRGLLTEEGVKSMMQWSHGGGFSVGAKVRIEADDRQGLERLFPLSV